jgi:hypothetical protein
LSSRANLLLFQANRLRALRTGEIHRLPPWVSQARPLRRRLPGRPLRRRGSLEFSFERTKQLAHNVRLAAGGDFLSVRERKLKTAWDEGRAAREAPRHSYAAVFALGRALRPALRLLLRRSATKEAAPWTTNANVRLSEIELNGGAKNQADFFRFALRLEGSTPEARAFGTSRRRAERFGFPLVALASRAISALTSSITRNARDRLSAPTAKRASSDEAGHWCDFLAVEVGDPADAGSVRPSPERRLARSVIGVGRVKAALFEHGRALLHRLDGEELEAEVRSACCHRVQVSAEALRFG